MAFEIILMGEFTNPSYSSTYKIPVPATKADMINPILWSGENTVLFSNYKGEAGKYITIRPYDSNTIIRGNGGNIFRVQNSEYLIIKDFVIEGEVDNITVAEANQLQFVYVNETDFPGEYNPQNILQSYIKFRNEDCIGFIDPDTGDETNKNNPAACNATEVVDGEQYTTLNSSDIQRPSF